MNNALKLVNTEEDLKALKKECTDKAIFILFWASWDESSETLKSMMEEMPSVYQNLRLAYVNCDESDLVDVLEVETVQTIVVIHPEGSGKKDEKHLGVRPEQLTELVQKENHTY